MDENKEAQISWRLDESLKLRFRTKIAGMKDVDASLVLTRFVEAFVTDRPEAIAIATENAELLQSASAPIEEMRRIAKERNIPFRDALNHAIALWLDFHLADSPMVRIPPFLKKSVAWIQRRFRSEAQAALLEGLLQKLHEFSQLQAESAPPQGGHSTKVDRAG